MRCVPSDDNNAHVDCHTGVTNLSYLTSKVISRRIWRKVQTRPIQTLQYQSIVRSEHENGIQGTIVPSTDSA